MADQVNPMGSLAPSLPLTLQAATQAPQVQEKPKPSRPATPPPQEAGRGDVPTESLESAVKAFEDYLKQSPSDLMFKVDESSGRTYFKIVDAVTKDVIRQVPSEEILAMARKLRELANPKTASGVLVDREG